MYLKSITNKKGERLKTSVFEMFCRQDCYYPDGVMDDIILHGYSFNPEYSLISFDDMVKFQQGLDRIKSHG